MSYRSLIWGLCENYDLGDDLFEEGETLVAELFEHDDKIFDEVLPE